MRDSSAAAASTSCSSATDDRRSPARSTSTTLMAAAADRFDDPADRPRGHGAAALHERHDRAPRRAPCTSTRPSSPTTRPAASALDLHADDVFWCTADPGWVTGTSYGIIAPLTHGVTSIVDEADFDADALVPRPSQDQRVTVWYTAPTALRMLMRAGADARRAATTCRACGSSPASASR